MLAFPRRIRREPDPQAHLSPDGTAATTSADLHRRLDRDERSNLAGSCDCPPDNAGKWRSLRATRPDYLSYLLCDSGDTGAARPEFAAAGAGVGFGRTDSRNCEEEEARGIIIEAALGYLSNIRKEQDSHLDEVFDDLEQHYRHRLATLKNDTEDIHTGHYKYQAKLSRDLLKVERQTAVRLRNQGRINDELLRDLERELDLSEARFLSSDTQA